MRDRVPFGPWGPLGIAVDPVTWKAAPYFIVAPVVGTACFVGLGLALPLSLVLVLVWVGLPMLAVLILLWRGVAFAERRFVRWTLGVDIPDPYRPRPEGGLYAHLRWLFVDPATWKDLGYVLLLCPLGLLEFVVVFGLWSLGLELLAIPLPLVLTDRTMSAWFVEVSTVPEAVLVMLVGVVSLVASLYALRGAALAHGWVARALLGTDDRKLLLARNEDLRASRARGVNAAEAERRRIERDLHDGAQQRLLSVALDLGRAQAKFDDDPQQARILVESAAAGAKAAIAELRDLARGIYPAILTDRGLDAALSSLAARAPVRVEVTVEITERPPAAVESIAYFVVAEALTNMAKYSEATEASVKVSRAVGRVVVEIADNGIGGAVIRPGGGLNGLADRAATIDGNLTVDSPPGGPTRIRAELPCVW
ncbi:sensor histidine kinase [Herbidospora galbida]|uniref:histidine kinase n=1 Tax=Herbidospora galbida TaxID=2575442 RepID=A0A4U3MQ22_9ACTN|nr:sensor histidine kinase [Herbidospora galbida]TKK90146.1 sensor histidine kinase [Herbidospora galbida]